MTKSSNVISIKQNNKSVSQRILSSDYYGSSSDIIKPNTSGRNTEMDNKYITEKDLQQFEKLQDSKMDRLSDKMESNFKSLDSKIDNSERMIISEIKNMFSEHEKNDLKDREQTRKDTDKAQKETRRWLIGTCISVIIGLGTILVTIYLS